MFIRNLKVSGIKLLRDFELSFLNSDGTPRQWTMLVGENGLCKTTVLQCIALAASGRSVSNAIADKSWVASLLDKRNEPEQAEIKAELGFRTNSHHARTYPGGLPRFDSPPTIESALCARSRTVRFQGRIQVCLGHRPHRRSFGPSSRRIIPSLVCRRIWYRALHLHSITDAQRATETIG